MFHIDPVGPVEAYKTFSLLLPAKTHYRKATCSEVGCGAHVNGWITRIDSASELGRKQLNYIRLHSGRTFYDVTTVDSSMVELTFPPGQSCFGSHNVPLEREPIPIVRDGDWRGNPTGRRRQHVRVADWIEDFGEHQQAIADEIEKG